MRLGLLTTHPIQYQVPLFRRLSQVPGVEFTAFFCDTHGLKPTFDPGFGRTIQFDVPLLEGYESKFLLNVAPRPGVRISGLLNPAVGIETHGLDALVVTGYAHLGTWLRAFWPRFGRSPRLLFRGESHLNEARPAWKGPLKRVPLTSYFRRFDRFLAVGSLNSEYLQHYGVQPEKIILAPYSVDNDYFAYHSTRTPRADVRAKFGLPREEVIFLTCSKLSEVKRPLDAIRAFAKVRAKGLSCALAMVGTGPLDEQVRAEIRRLNLTSSVFLLGFQNQSELPAIYAACDALVLPSNVEPWGLVVNEAMASGIPAIVSDRVGSGPDLVEGTGLIFPVGNVDRLADAMTLWVRDVRALGIAKARSKDRIATWGIPETANAVVEAARQSLEER